MTIPSVHLVLQRYRSCEILLEEKEWVTVPAVQMDGSSAAAAAATSKKKHCGLLVYVSFTASATQESVARAAQALLHVPILTTGLWGDDTKPVSFSTLLQEQEQQEQHVSQCQTSMTIVPQANLISKLKSNCKSIQYHGQMNKTDSQALFAALVQEIRRLVLLQLGEEQQPQFCLPDWYKEWKNSTTTTKSKSTTTTTTTATTTIVPASTPPALLFVDHYSAKYSSVDSKTGLPLTDAHGQPLTKSALKRARKLLEAHTKRHAKWKAKQQQQQAAAKNDTTKNDDSALPKNDQEAVRCDGTRTTSVVGDTTTTYNDNNNNNNNNSDPSAPCCWEQRLDEFFVQHAPHVVAGSFGKRQGVVLHADMGPFCHTLQL